ncbi:MAG: SDR family NAD(P)-dependent oxidoreductase [Bacteroidota bacterium]
MQLSEKQAKRLRTKYGDWALVTGATSGIGKGIANQLAMVGFNLVITGRRKSLLAALTNDFAQYHNAEIVAISGDLSQAEEVQRLLEETALLPIGISILNAGFGTSGGFLKADIATEANMLDLNCRSLLLMTHHFARQFAQKKGGAIVLMSSMVAFQGVPNAANYAATKAYVQSLGEALAVELRPQGIDVLCAAPGPVESEFAERANMRLGKAMQPQQVSVSILKAIGRKGTVLPGFMTKFLVFNLRLTPRWAKIRIMQKVMEGFTKHQ